MQCSTTAAMKMVWITALYYLQSFTKMKPEHSEILTTSIAQGYSQIHGIISRVGFNCWVSSIFYTKIENRHE